MSITLRYEPLRRPPRFQNTYPEELDGRMSPHVFLTRMQAVNFIVMQKPPLSRYSQLRILVAVFLLLIIVLALDPAGNPIASSKVTHLVAIVVASLIIISALLLFFTRQYAGHKQKVRSSICAQLERFNITDNAVGINWKLETLPNVVDTWMNPNCPWSINVEFIEPVERGETPSGHVIEMQQVSEPESLPSEQEETVTEYGLPPPIYTV